MESMPRTRQQKGHCYKLPKCIRHQSVLLARNRDSLWISRKILNSGDYILELESNTVKKRVGIYLQKDIGYIRRYDLEKPDLHIVIIDVLASKKFPVIILHRSFRPQGGVSPEIFFAAQIEVVKNALTKNCLVMGDFNLDVRMALRNDYIYKIPLSRLTDFTDANNLIQLVKFNTCSRTINGVRKESLLDNIYVDDRDFREPTFGDHLLVFVELAFCDNFFI